MALFAPLIATQDPYLQNLSAVLQPPGGAHFFGTDEVGRDVFSRIVYGSRITLTIIALVAVIVGPIGLAVGTLAGYFGGWFDTVLMRVTDIFLSFPSLILSLAFVAALGAGLENAIVAIALTSWPPIARLARAETLTLRGADYVSAAKLQGASSGRIIWKSIVPMCMPSVLVRLTLSMASVILTAAGLGFLGLGAQPPLPEWGAMIAIGRRYMLESWWLVAFPGAAILCVSLAFNLIGDGLQGRARSQAAEGAALMETLMDVRNLCVTYGRGPSAMQAVRNVSFTLGRERLGIVGESGSGKSTIGRALLKLLPTATITADRMDFLGTDLIGASERRMLDIRGARISMILQDPKFSLNPVKRVGDQIAEAYAVHHRGARREAREKALEMLEAVQIRDPERVYRLYPHEISGGMGQRVMIAMMLVPEPEVIIADEPTSALDVTVRMKVLGILDALVRERGIGLIMISPRPQPRPQLLRPGADHVRRARWSRHCRRRSSADARHDYTRGLLAAQPHIGGTARRWRCCGGRRVGSDRWRRRTHERHH